MGFIAADADDLSRIADSVHFTEAYKDRVMGLLGQRPTDNIRRSNMPVRGILLQNVYGGQDGLISLLGRDQSVKAWLVSLVGVNTFPITANQFQLQLTGIMYDPDTGAPTPTVIGTSDVINCCSTAATLQTAMMSVSRLWTGESLSVGLGNPYLDVDLQVYGDVVAPVLDSDLPASYTGSWFIQIDDLLGYQDLQLTVVNQTISSLTNVIVYPIFDIISAATEVATDCSYRTQDYPWQVGTIVTCVDYADVGYGILSATARTIALL